MNTTMKFVSMIACSVFAAASVHAQDLDFRNAVVSNGKIYAGKSNTPFTGRLTNLPMGRMRVGSIGTFIKVVGSATKDTAYTEAITMSALSVAVNNFDSAILCNVSMVKGVLNGGSTCQIGTQGMPLVKMSFKQGVVDGKATVYALRKGGKGIAEATWVNGRMEGPSVIYSPKTGKLVHRTAWKEDKPVGVEEAFDENTGVLTFKATLNNGLYDGEANTYSPEGKMTARVIYREGAVVENTKFDDQPAQ